MNALNEFDDAMTVMREEENKAEKAKYSADCDEDYSAAEAAEYAFAFAIQRMSEVYGEIEDTLAAAQEVIDREKSSHVMWGDLCDLMLETLSMAVEAMDNSTMPESAKFAGIQGNIKAWKSEIEKRKVEP